MEACSMRRMAMVGGGALVATVAVDQASKAVVRATIPEDAFVPIAGQDWLGLTNYRNDGVSYGLLPGVGPLVPAIVTAGLGGALAFTAGRTHRPLLAAAGAGLVVGGGIGNVIDRLHEGSVRDFLHVTDAFANFNLADTAVWAGLGAFGAAMILKR